MYCGRFAQGNESLSARRAWIEILPLLVFCLLILSLSARRAWIEIVHLPIYAIPGAVALRKESVDRNINNGADFIAIIGSLSARRAWIEIRIDCMVAQ